MTVFTEGPRTAEYLISEAPGHLSREAVTVNAAAGALEAVAAVLSITNRAIPPTMGTSAVDAALPQIDLVTGEARPWEPAPVLSNSFGFGGHNGCLVIGPADA